MTPLKFTKMHGAGNDFVMLDARDIPAGLELSQARIAALCDRRMGVGADGLIILGTSDQADVRMTYYNADGGEAEMCGNGARCTVAFAHAQGLLQTSGLLDTFAGPLEVKYHGYQDIEVQLPRYTDLVIDFQLSGSPYTSQHTCNTGVPHLIIPLDDIEDVPVMEHGRSLRRHELFEPAGTNVNWITERNGEWLLRTYERGVEAETLACGTGASAAAVVLTKLGLASSPVAIRTRSGDLLTITVDHDDRKLFLRGPAVVAFQGEVSINE